MSVLHVSTSEWVTGAYVRASVVQADLPVAKGAASVVCNGNGGAFRALGAAVWKKSKRGFRRTSIQKMRSKTFPGIARAMAEQWAGPCEEKEATENV